MLNDNIETSIIFAAGLGSRMGAFTQEIPKALARINGRTLLDIVIRQIVSAGIKHIFINVHYKAAAIINHLCEQDNGVELTIVEEPELLETGGSFVNLQKIIGRRSPILTCNVDTIWVERDETSSQIKFLIDKWFRLPDDKKLLMLVSDELYGAPANKDFKVVEDRLWYVPSGTDHYYIGSQIIDPGLLDNHAQKRKFSFADVYKDLAGEEGYMNNSYAMKFDGEAVFHVGDTETLEKAAQYSRKCSRMVW